MACVKLEPWNNYSKSYTFNPCNITKRSIIEALYHDRFNRIFRLRQALVFWDHQENNLFILVVVDVEVPIRSHDDIYVFRIFCIAIQPV